MLISPKIVYDNLDKIEQLDLVIAAIIRQQAQEILANAEVSLKWRQAIADRLNQANYFLGMVTVLAHDSY